MRRLGIVVCLFAFLACALPAHAYVDPGAGSMLLQLLLGGLAGLLFAGRLFGRRIARFLGWGKDRDQA